MDRRHLIMGLTTAGAVLTFLGGLFSGQYVVVLLLGFIVGGVANPLYSLIIAYTNDFLEPSDMAAASGGLLFINGLGAMTGPLIIGALMTRFGANAFFAYIGTLFALIAGYALYRMTKRAATPIAETSSYAPVLPQASPVALEVAQEVAIGRAGNG
jgi:MFS family permease